MPRVYQRIPPDERFWPKVDAFGDCWEWTARIHELGYGQFHPAPGTCIHAHIYAWETLVGPVPAGMELDHLCRNRRCVNPDHLEPVTHTENVRRTHRVSGATCQRGHRWDDANTGYQNGGWRYCRTCKKQRLHARHEQRGG